MAIIATGLDYADVRFRGYPGIIATGILHGRAGLALVDPGPQTSLATLTAELRERGMSTRDVTELVVTHIHLDHSGAAGHLVRENPAITVYVHAIGAPHLIDPSRLLASASKLYGADMQRLWGEILPIPAANVRALQGGERITAAGRALRVAYTPGHAKHHVSYLDEASGLAFVGDTLGIRRAPGTYVMPPAPPPDIDLDAWFESVRRILAWKPSSVFLTHFGPFDHPSSHADELVARLEEWAGLASALLGRTELSDAQRCGRFVEDVRRDLRRRMSAEDAEGYERSGRIDYSWTGLARALSK
ncbi:MAG: MBL fold metallo-hydrolase [Acidobacteria bacterium]|nr:MBL fold metallo-hydrolase [Acidobacteriota bacterium]